MTTSSAPTKKRFEDYPTVDCNECREYWNDTCDGSPKGAETRCTAFKAVRRVDVPIQIKRLERRLNWHTATLFVIGIIFITLMIKGVI